MKTGFKVIYPNYHKNSNESCFEADLAIRVAVNYFAIFLKYCTSLFVFTFSLAK